MASAQFVRDVLIFLLGIQNILKSCAWTLHQDKVPTKPLQTIREFITEETQGLPESEFFHDTKLIQIVDESNSRTNYFIQNEEGQLEFVFKGNFTDWDKSILVFQVDKCRKNFEPEIYIVLRKLSSPQSFYDGSELHNYFYASVVFTRSRTNTDFQIEWDSWDAHFSNELDEMPFISPSDGSTFDLLMTGIRNQFKLIDQCSIQRNKPNRRIQKRDLLAALAAAKDEDGGLRLIPEFMEGKDYEEVPKPRPKAVARSKTTGLGNAVANALNRKTGPALSKAEATGTGDAHANAGSYGKGGSGNKVAVASASTLKGGAAKAKAHSDGHRPKPEMNDDYSKNPGPAGLLLETDREFKGVLEYTRVSKRSVGEPPNNYVHLKCNRFQSRMAFIENEYFKTEQSSVKDSNLKKSSVKNKCLAKGFKEGHSDFADFLSTHSKWFKNVLTSATKHENNDNPTPTTPRSCKISIPAIENVFTVLDLECNNKVKSYLEMTLMREERLIIESDGSIRISETLPILHKKKLSPEEITRLKMLIIFSAVSSANKIRNESLNSNEDSKNESTEDIKSNLLPLFVTEWIKIANTLGKQHRMKLIQSVSNILEDIFTDLILDIQNCKKFRNPSTKSHPRQSFFDEMKMLITLERFMSVKINSKTFDSNYDVGNLFWKYYIQSNSSNNKLLRCISGLG